MLNLKTNITYIGWDVENEFCSTTAFLNTQRQIIWKWNNLENFRSIKFYKIHINTFIFLYRSSYILKNSVLYNVVTV